MSNADLRHDFVLVLPVAERPQQLASCLESLAEALRQHPYAGNIRVVVADDSASPESVREHARIIDARKERGFSIFHLAPEASFSPEEPLASPTFLGDARLHGHRGQAAARNRGILWALRRWRNTRTPTLVWSIDSDQLFCIDATGATIDYFSLLDRLFADPEIVVATGKVVGDPPVSPAVMTANLLADLIHFLARFASLDAESPCTFHRDAQPTADAAYHDLADLFGFTPPERCDYACPLPLPHRHLDCLAALAFRLERFWHGEHPTRACHYQAQDFQASVAPARTVYAGNYVFRLQAPGYPLPFAHLRLRMSGPTLGRILKAQLAHRFVSANFPLYHRRVAASGAGFRPGVENWGDLIDIADEYERQFYGDVMLFTVERFAATLMERRDPTFYAEQLAHTRLELRERYRERRAAIHAHLAHFGRLLDEIRRASPRCQEPIKGFSRFAEQVRHNFVHPAHGFRRIEDERRWASWQSRLAAALVALPDDYAQWMHLV
ncbi:MAG: hypothetical protein N2441_05980 [Rhodocyclaceae bacterium]|nr:hypothetical protein [Rhodocyclaceae bacterium]